MKISNIIISIFVLASILSWMNAHSETSLNEKDAKFCEKMEKSKGKV